MPSHLSLGVARSAVEEGRTELFAKQGQGDQSGDDQQQGEEHLDGGAEHIRGSGFVLAARAEVPLHNRLIANPVGGAQHQAEAQKYGGPGILGMVGRWNEREMMGGPSEPRRLEWSAAWRTSRRHAPGRCMQIKCRTNHQHDAREGVGDDHGLQPAHGRVDTRQSEP